jgi:MFS family permease
MPASLRQNRFFIRYVVALSGSFFAYNMLVVAIGWQMYEITNSALSLGLVGLVQFVAHLMSALVAGLVADRYDRRRITYICQALQAVTVGVLALASYSGWVTSHVIYICAFGIAAARAFYSTATQALLPTLVERSQLLQAISVSQVTRNASAIAGPALGGFVYLLGAGSAYTLTAAFFLIASILMASIRLPRAEVHAEPATLKSVFSDIAYIRRQPAMLGAISLDLFAVLLNGTTALLPIFARDILQTGSWGLGLLRAAPALGATAAAAVLIRYALNRRVGHVLFASVAVFGALTVVFALSEYFILSLVVLAIWGAADMVSVVIRTSLVQLDTPDDVRGRVSAVNSIFIGTSNQLGQFQAGVVASLIGAMPAVLLGGIATLAVTALWMRLFPSLVKRDVLALPAKA